MSQFPQHCSPWLHPGLRTSHAVQLVGQLSCEAEGRRIADSSVPFEERSGGIERVQVDLCSCSTYILYEGHRQQTSNLIDKRGRLSHLSNDRQMFSVVSLRGPAARGSADPSPCLHEAEKGQKARVQRRGHSSAGRMRLAASGLGKKRQLPSQYFVLAKEVHHRL